MSAQLVSQIPELERQADELERQARAIRQIVSGVLELAGDAAPARQRSFESHRTIFEVAPLDRTGPRGPEAVLTVMHEEPERDWKVIEVKREVLRRGWAPTPKAVEASVKRLRLAGRIHSVRYGHYRLAGTSAHDNGVGLRAAV